MPTTTAPEVVHLTRVYHFSAGHRLRNPALSDEDNARRYGACARPHGHNYYLELTVAGTPDGETGMVLDLGRLDEVVEQRILERVDHHTLEDVPELAGVISTGEGLARAFWDLLVDQVTSAVLRQVAVVETANNRFEYRGENP